LSLANYYYGVTTGHVTLFTTPSIILFQCALNFGEAKGAPGVLTPKTVVVSATDKTQFASAMLVAISAGIGFDTVFNRLQKQAQDVAIGPPRGK